MVRSDVWSIEGSVRASEFKWDGAPWKGLEPEEGKGEVFQPSPLKERKGVSWRSNRTWSRDPEQDRKRDPMGEVADNGPGLQLGSRLAVGKGRIKSS